MLKVPNAVDFGAHDAVVIVEGEVGEEIGLPVVSSRETLQRGRGGILDIL